jgi:outer membrane protein assembly factor BamA
MSLGLMASRFAASSSFGGSPLIYYLGSVDNWLNLFGKVATFDQSVPIDYTKNYAYQTLATNMRGFTQNIRNGNNFALINTELRWPVIRYFANHPISSNFWNNFQAVGFFDLGSAWTGLTPWSGKNAYDKETYENGPITVIIDSNREPLVAGYGFGLRSQLLGYFVRVDWAWGIENRMILPRIFYLSLNLDF